MRIGEMTNSDTNLDPARPTVPRLDRANFPDGPPPGGSGIPMTIPNLEHLLDAYGIRCRFNLIKKRVELADASEGRVSLNRILSLTALNCLPGGNVQHFIYDIAESRAFNPALEWIRSRPWDGRDRLSDLYATVVTAEEYPAALKETLLRRWLLGAAAAVLKPGFHTRGVLTFQGPQGCGKTSWGRSLISDPSLRDELIKVDHHLDGSNKDSVLGAIRHWIVVIGELDSSFKKDIARLKGFLTNSYDKLRPPYARVEAEYPRQTVFFATVNEYNFLIDATGNTRWWTIAVEKLEFDHDIDMQQLFAQVATQVEEGEQWWLTPDEEKALEAWNARHKSVSVIREKILEHLDLDRREESSLRRMTPLELLNELGMERPNNSQCRECGSILRELLGPPKRVRGRDKWAVPLPSEVQNRWVRPPVGREAPTRDVRLTVPDEEF